MLGSARKYAAEADVLEQVTFCQTDVGDLPDLFSVGEFDAVLCHNMIKFVEDGNALLDDLYTLLMHGGLLSILTISRNLKNLSTL